MLHLFKLRSDSILRRTSDSDIRSKTITAFPDHAATSYDDRIEHLVPGYRLVVDVMASTLGARRPRPTSVLVPGCGTGAELLAAALVMPDALFTAIDPSQGMLDVAQRKAKAEGSYARIAFHHGLLDETGGAIHDAAMLSLVLHFLPDDGAKRDLLTGIARRLCKGAPLLLFDAVKPDDEDAALHDWLQRRGHSCAEASAVIERMQGNWHRVPLERLVGLLEQTGFHIREPFFRAFSYLGILAERA